MMHGILPEHLHVNLAVGMQHFRTLPLKQGKALIDYYKTKDSFFYYIWIRDEKVTPVVGVGVTQIFKQQRPGGHYYSTPLRPSPDLTHAPVILPAPLPLKTGHVIAWRQK